MSRGAVQEIFSPFPSPSYIQLGVYELRLVQEIFSFPWLYILALMAAARAPAPCVILYILHGVNKSIDGGAERTTDTCVIGTVYQRTFMIMS